MIPNNAIVSEVCEIQETCMPRGQFKHRYWFFADTLFEKIYDVEPKSKSVSQLDTMPLFGNNNWFQMTKTCFAEQF